MKRMRIPTIGSLLLVLCPGVGLPGDGVVAFQTADPSCGDDSGNTYVDCGNGTVTDNRTGLVWLENADCIGEVDWYTAMEFVAGLSDMTSTSVAAAHDCGLSDGSSPGEWRLPAAAEWEAMVADADGGPGELLCDPEITNDQGTGCWSPSCKTAGFCSFSGVRQAFYWSSLSLVTDPARAWVVSTSGGTDFGTSKGSITYVWPVRGGQ